jgi:hypothetical protein
LATPLAVPFAAGVSAAGFAARHLLMRSMDTARMVRRACIMHVAATGCLSCPRRRTARMYRS